MNHLIGSKDLQNITNYGNQRNCKSLCKFYK